MYCGGDRFGIRQRGESFGKLRHREQPGQLLFGLALVLLSSRRCRGDGGRGPLGFVNVWRMQVGRKGGRRLLEERVEQGYDWADVAAGQPAW